MNDNNGYFNQSYYQNIPTNEVNWAALAQQWIRQSQPNQEFMQPNWGPSPSTGAPVRFPRSNYYGGQPPSMSPYESNMNHYPPQHPPYYRPQPRPLNFFSSPVETPKMPRPRPLNLIEVNPWASGAPPQHIQMQRQPPPPQPTPLFPSANRLPAQVNHAWDMPSGSQYEWSNEPPPPPPSQPAWISSDASNQEQPILDQIERKKLPNWILEGLERMEKEKKLREEKEEKRKNREKLEKQQEEQRKALGKSKFDSDDDEELPKRRFEEYPEMPTLTEVEKEQIKRTLLKEIISSVLLRSTDLVIHKCCDDAIAHFKAKRAAKVVVNKATAALTALASLGGDSSDDEEPQNEQIFIPSTNSTISEKKNNESGDKIVDHLLNHYENTKSRRSKSPKSHHRRKSKSRSRSRSPVRRHSSSDHHRRSSRDDYEKDDDNRSHHRFDSSSSRRSSGSWR